ncbi:MAG: PD-(D/E)XK nuclease family protein [Candidatus Schekmanbacteria bacterium]|nr:PD-(D/E)XK nuclease family protein [Candidatus Schekmanbacteria bacterium]
MRDSKEYIKSIQYSVKLKPSHPKPLEKTPTVSGFLQNFPYSASSLDSYLSCPFKFYYRYVLRVKAKEDNADLYIGNIVHEALYKYFQGKTQRTLTENDLNTGELDLIIANLFEKRYGQNLPGNVYLLRRQIRKHLADFIENYQIPLVRNCSVEVIHLEHQINFIKNSYRFFAKLDRVEKRNGRVTIIDYKTSSNKDYLRINFNKLDVSIRDTWPDAIGSLQLPVYLLAYSEAEKTCAENIDCLFLLLGMTELNDKIEAPLFNNSEEAEEEDAILQTVIWELLKEITDIDQPFLPTDKPRDLCPDCDFRYICSV